MANLSVLIAPNPLLRKKAVPVLEVDASIKKLLSDMMETLEVEDGIGLAAPQVGVSKRVLIMHVPANISVDREELKGIEPEPSLFKMINPEITWASEEKSTCQEGCLSVPGQYAPIVRPAKIRVKYLDENGQSQEREFQHLQAACVQHEMDHLDGKLFVDYLSFIKRDMFIKKANKLVNKK